MFARNLSIHLKSNMTFEAVTSTFHNRFRSLKTLSFVIFSLCFAPGIIALSQDAPNQASKTSADIGARLATIMGTVREDGEKLRFVTEQRAWKVDNPEILKGHEGHYVHVAAYIYPDKNLIHIIEVKIPTARETREADIK
jgi:hypothetical protein